MLTKFSRTKAWSELYLRTLNMTINSKCNRKCINCCGEVKNREDMKLSKIKEMLTACVDGGGINFVYPSCKAEMTLHSDCVEIVRHMHTFRRTKVIVHQDTNAGYIPDGLIQAINDCNFRYNLCMSIWAGEKELYKKLQGGDFSETEKNARKYLENLKYPPAFSLPFINEEQVKSGLQFLKELCAEYKKEIFVLEKAEEVKVDAVKREGKIPVFCRKYISYNDKTKLTDIYNKGKREDYYVSPNNCSMLFYGIYLNADGFLSPCQGVDRMEGMKLANVYDYNPITWQDIVKIYHTDYANKLRTDNKTPGKCAFEKVCPTCCTRINY